MITSRPSSIVVAIVLSAAAAITVSALAFFGLMLITKPFFPECSPGQIVGQCGLATFLQLTLCFLLGVAIWLATMIFTLRRFLRVKHQAGRTI